MWNSGMLLLHRRIARLQIVLFSYICLLSFALSPKYTHCFHVPLVWPGACLTLEVFRDLKLIALCCGALCDVKIRARMAEKLTAKYQYCPGERDKERGAACAVWSGEAAAWQSWARNCLQAESPSFKLLLVLFQGLWFFILFSQTQK